MSYSLAFPLLNVSVRPRQHAHFPATWNENTVSTKLFIFNGIEKVTPLHFFHRTAAFFAATIPSERQRKRCWSVRTRTGSIRHGGGALEDMMSLTPIGFRSLDGSSHKVTTATLREQKLRHEPITCLTAYDYAAARLVDGAGVDMVLVGDSLAQTMLGYENTLSITVDEMLTTSRPSGGA